MKNKKVLVVGGCGYIGGYTTDLLSLNNFDVTIYDNLLYEDRFLKNVNFINGDIRDTNFLVQTAEKFDVIVLLAALVGDPACSVDQELTNQINYNSIKDFCLKISSDKHIIFMSTCSVYGAQDGFLNEESPTNPLSTYASTKLKSEKHILEKNGTIFRLGTVFGLGDAHSRLRMDLVVNVLTAKAIIDKKLTVFGGRQFRPLLHVKDTARIIEESIRSKNTGIFNLHLENIKIIDLAERVKNLFEDVKIEKVDIKFQDARNYQADGTKLRKNFNFRPKYTIEDGVNEVKKLIIEKRIRDINDPRYTNQKYLEIFKEKLKFKE